MKHPDFNAVISRLYPLDADTGGVELPLVPLLATASYRQQPLLLAVPDKSSAERVFSDLVALSTDIEVHFIGYSLISGVDDGQATRALRLLLEDVPGIYLTIASDMLGGFRREALDFNEYHVGKQYVMQDVEASLDAFGFERVSFVVEPGTFSVRGGILDVFPGEQEAPLRMDFLGNMLESMHAFDPGSQRSGVSLDHVRIYTRNPYDTESTSLLLDFIPSRCSIFHFRPQLEDSPSASLADQLLRDRRRGTVMLYQARGVDPSFSVEVQPEFHRNLAAFRARLSFLNENNYQVFLCADSPVQLDRLGVLFKGATFSGLPLSLASGFIDHNNKLAVLTDHQIFGRGRKRNVIARRFPVKPATSIEAFDEGDVVVHLDFGVGKYLGVERIPFKQGHKEVLTLEYELGDRIYVPVDKMNRVHKYESHVDQPSKLTRLRTTEWEQAKLKTKNAVDTYTKELMELYANRFVAAGHAFGEDDELQQKMEAAFVYDETSDQLQAIAEIKKDMQSPFPMDRLLCGDVGFGKTEVAMRASFKAVSNSRQVGVLVPTTILAQQHLETFSDRFKDFPVSIGLLSRFRTSKQIRETLAQLEAGEIDIVVGTHRLLSQDVVFKSLGLLIIDEEHRFGVKHKERIKEMMTAVDSLSMTATPIPRTLQMSLMGARDISTLKVPPKERQPIETHVIHFDEKVIRSAILREVDRGGQVFFVHNRVESIGVVLSKLQVLLPEVKFGVGHGQMAPRELERVMLGFFHREFDVLLSTTIVESGLDIPNANTMIVNRADAMGLSQLYQLRGRVGRSSRKAWSYFITPGFNRLSVTASRRLNALERHAHYGGGYELAMRDLEIRGSGNIFGTDQSGHISNIGYHLYTKMLQETLELLRAGEDETVQTYPQPEISTDRSAGIPREYIDDTAERIAVYRRISGAENSTDLGDLRNELRERFGVLPREVSDLLDISLIKHFGQALGLERLSIKEKRGQGDFFQKHVEQAGSVIIKSLSKSMQDFDSRVELMNNKSLTFVFEGKTRQDTVFGLRKFLESLAHSYKFFA
ncbi:MAG: transcription-repair coupling factor [Candidatus Marinimicrobia bacterium]|nr:transcription-repair coupling factor [Candidatus Neomarinimicrobiota bacterium]MCF7903869.1 transcription-repair coupling factor [Candidatus Neomarinimicrobiota bacterium]